MTTKFVHSDIVEFILLYIVVTHSLHYQHSHHISFFTSSAQLFRSPSQCAAQILNLPIFHKLNYVHLIEYT
jgi:hypothetical protein